MLAGAQANPEPPRPGPRDRCAVCGMLVAKHAQWAAAIVFRDKHTVHFDGVKDLLRYVFDLNKFRPGLKREDIQACWVTDYYSAKSVLVKDCFFVAGSDILGPMGHELIPVRGREAALTFQKDHRGRRIFTWEEITPAVLEELD